MGTEIQSELALVSAAISLGARSVPKWSAAEEELASSVPANSDASIQDLQRAVRSGEDPLGDAFCRLRSPEDRRPLGATYTPAAIVEAMLDWAEAEGRPDTVVDPGAGSGRFLLAAGHRFPSARLCGIEVDPLAALLCRANLTAAGWAERSQVMTGDYRGQPLPEDRGTTLFVGNPPYVRHHLLESRWKEWLGQEACRLGFQASRLAGLHVHFFLATVRKARRGDFGVFITSAEWLDVNYGKLVRDLFVQDLGGTSILVLDSAVRAFPDAATTAVISTFKPFEKTPTVFFRRAASMDDLGKLGQGLPILRDHLAARGRWSQLTRRLPEMPEGFVELGELCRVHRGQVTGANKIWIAGPHSRDLPPEVLFPTVTRARELFEAGVALADGSHLRKVIDLPVDLDLFSEQERSTIERFLQQVQKAGADSGYVARNRQAWWSVGLRRPAPILATYMARRPPAFVRNLAGVRHINIAHGLYPREELSEECLLGLVSYLRREVDPDRGRTYSGGLTKFEPREMERIPVPAPALLPHLPLSGP